MNFEILLMEMAAKEKKNYVLELLKKLNNYQNGDLKNVDTSHKTTSV